MSKHLRTVYFAIFDSVVIRYAIQVWGLHNNQAINEIEKLQEKAIRIMSFKGRNDNTNSIFKKLEIMKFKDILRYNVIFAYDQINAKLPEIFKDFFVNSTTYGLNSLNYRAASDWNQISKNLNTEDKSQLIKSLREHILNSYN